MFKVFGISNTGAFSVCGNNVDANLCLPPHPNPLPHRGQSDGAREVLENSYFFQKPAAKSL